MVFLRVAVLHRFYCIVFSLLVFIHLLSLLCLVAFYDDNRAEIKINDFDSGPRLFFSKKKLALGLWGFPQNNSGAQPKF